MRRTESLMVGEKKVTFRELTVSEVRDMLMSRTDQDFVSYFYYPDVTFAELSRMTDLSVDDFESFTQSQMDAVRDKAKEINPSFFVIRTALLESIPKKTESDHS